MRVDKTEKYGIIYKTGYLLNMTLFIKLVNLLRFDFVLHHENAEGFEENRKYVYNLLSTILDLIIVFVPLGGPRGVGLK